MNPPIALLRRESRDLFFLNASVCPMQVEFVFLNLNLNEENCAVVVPMLPTKRPRLYRKTEAVFFMKAISD